MQEEQVAITEKLLLKPQVYKSRVLKRFSLKSLVGSNAGERGFALGLKKEHYKGVCPRFKKEHYKGVCSRYY